MMSLVVVSNKRMKLASGMKVIVDNSYEKFDEELFKQHLASALDGENSMIPTPTNNQDTGNPIADLAGGNNPGGGTASSAPGVVQTDPEEETTL